MEEQSKDPIWLEASEEEVQEEVLLEALPVALEYRVLALLLGELAET